MIQTLCDYCRTDMTDEPFPNLSTVKITHDGRKAEFHICGNCESRIEGLKLTFLRGMSSVQQRLAQKEQK